MGYNTDFVGHVLVDPPLNTEEAEYLIAFNHTRRWDRPDPYFILDHPMQPDPHDDIDRYNQPAPGEPGLWCPWVPCLDGHCLTVDGTEKTYGAGRWFDYLVGSFLAPGAAVAKLRDPRFAAFTFDHVCEGVVAASRRDTGELSLIVVTDSEVEELVVMPGVPEEVVWGDLPYQAEADLYRRRSALRTQAWRDRLEQRRSLRSVPSP